MNRPKNRPSATPSKGSEPGSGAGAGANGSPGASSKYQIAPGTLVTLTTKDGDIIEGHFDGNVCINQIHGVAIKFGRIVSSRRSDRSVPKGASLKFKLSEMVDLVPAEGSRKDSFATDTEISKTEAKGAAGKARELARWEDVVPQPHQAIELDEEATRLGTQWDQFEVNHKLFGVSTSFDENIYTIPLDRSSRAYKEREAEAQRIAAEMMRNVGTGGNVHLAEERGLAIDDSQIDEEDRYGAVVRAAPASSEDCAKRPHHPSSGMSQSASARHRKSIANLHADSESLEAALHVVQKTTQTVSRRLSQINETDLANILASEASPKTTPPPPVSTPADSKPKTKALNPNASEFIPSFELNPPAQAAAAVTVPQAPAVPATPYYEPSYVYGYYGGMSPYQASEYYDPNYYYNAEAMGYYGAGGGQVHPNWQQQLYAGTYYNPNAQATSSFVAPHPIDESSRLQQQVAAAQPRPHPDPLQDQASSSPNC